MVSNLTLGSISDFREHFREAYHRGIREDLWARLGGKENDLLPFETLASVLKSYQQIPRPASEMIPLDKIVGSVGRYKDFTRDFMPRSEAMLERWARVEEAMSGMVGVPPIEVYKMGDVYFVADGNHRVSVARANGYQDIDAHVTEIPVDVGLEPGDTLDQAIIKAERVRLMEETKLDRRFPHLDIYFTIPGGYPRLLRHIRSHQSAMAEDRGEGDQISLEDAAADWYVKVYLPIIDALRGRHLLERFPNRTVADLYVWIWGYIGELYEKLGERVEPAKAAEALEAQAPTLFQLALQEVMTRIAKLSRGLIGTPGDVPDWVAQSLEWGDMADGTAGTDR